MTDSAKAWTAITLAFVLCVTAFGSITVMECQKTERVKYQSGYQQVSVPGISYPIWQKPKAVADSTGGNQK